MKNEIFDFQSQLLGQSFHHIITQAVDFEKSHIIQWSFLQINDDKFTFRTNLFGNVRCWDNS